jgi:hypothetical protein
MIFDYKKKTSFENKRSFGSSGARRFVFKLLILKSSSKNCFCLLLTMLYEQVKSVYYFISQIGLFEH